MTDSAKKQAIQAKADRMAAILERRADRAAGIMTYTEEVKEMYSNMGR